MCLYSVEFGAIGRSRIILVRSEGVTNHFLSQISNLGAMRLNPSRDPSNDSGAQLTGNLGFYRLSTWRHTLLETFSL
ncbi:hypothetical protein TNCV_1882341 [Trichonephila clavipes]|uniref:Uncharacterized protein n=1 Tax=Trichonephila inaurata madagascariensis TaxID=2747483 RepID=A0A8X7C4D5_9ARAC|nr:hypothetical protein TNCV_1882341 [Trichonephila clavipes]GFY52099.1 hypothetical protein TNIN_65241 [Trichonephila inaurata madagascariensis]